MSMLLNFLVKLEEILYTVQAGELNDQGMTTSYSVQIFTFTMSSS